MLPGESKARGHPNERVRERVRENTIVLEVSNVSDLTLQDDKDDSRRSPEAIIVSLTFIALVSVH